MYPFSVNGIQFLAKNTTITLGLPDSHRLGSPGFQGLGFQGLGTPRLDRSGLSSQGLGIKGPVILSVAIRVTLCIDGITLIRSQCDSLVEHI